MKRKILYIGAVAIISFTTFIIGRNSVENTPKQAQETDVTPDSGYINVNDIKGWETWNDNEKVYLSVGDWVISKEPYTTNTKAKRME
ncbi:hypothetical protein [Mediterraneibacter gnavus]|uniref:hypothetical protein n=1 Tax=Mediterraneibacter gnavus TaxID=33038 RepID=UPI0019213052|nr:hypothetical protein [Mediterraneibacter gnavus]